MTRTGSRIQRFLAKLPGAFAVIVGVTFLTFLLSYLSPTDPATTYFTSRGMVPTDAELAAKRAEFGLDRPIVEQYASWVADLLRADMGTSYRSGEGVASSFARALPYTLALTVSSLVVVLAVSVPLGLACAWRKDGLLDRAVGALTYLFNALPSFFVSLVLLYVLSVRLGWFTVVATPDLKGLVMPTLAMAIPLSAWYTRQVRAIALGQLARPHVDGLRSRGVPEASILFKHVLRGCLVPLLTLVGLSVGSLLGGTAIVESIFSWPGVGNLSVSAIGYRDYPVIQGYALLMAVVYLVANALVDLACRRADPHVRAAGAR